MVKLSPSDREPFYEVTVDVLVYDGEYPVIGSPEYKRLSQQLYKTDWDQPLLNIDGVIIKPRAQGSIPADTVVLPSKMVDDEEETFPIREKTVLVARPEYVREFVI